VRKEVKKVVTQYLTEYVTQNEEVMKTVIEKVNLSAKARVAAKLARETVMRKNALIG
jgi:DNA gyrase subunit B